MCSSPSSQILQRNGKTRSRIKVEALCISQYLEDSFSFISRLTLVGQLLLHSSYLCKLLFLDNLEFSLEIFLDSLLKRFLTLRNSALHLEMGTTTIM